MANQPDTSRRAPSVASGASAAMAPSVTTPAAGSVPRLPSHAIFAGAQEVEIEHNGAVYRLRQTSLGKLILTK